MDLEVEEPQTLTIKQAPPVQTTCHKVYARRSEVNVGMPGPGGTRSKRVRPANPSQAVGGVSTRSSIRLHSSMKTMQKETSTDGEPTLHSAEVVSKVLSQSNRTSTVPRNAGISLNHHESEAERELHEQLVAEKDGTTSLSVKVDALKKKAEVAVEKLEKAR